MARHQIKPARSNNRRQNASVATNDIARQPTTARRNTSAKTKTAERLFAFITTIYLIACAGEFIYFSEVFGRAPAFILCLIATAPAMLALYKKFRWTTLELSDWGLIALVLILAVGTTITLVRQWHHLGLQHRPGIWTFIQPEHHSKEDACWEDFTRALVNDSSFRKIRVNLTRVKHIYYVSGSLASKADLERLIKLAQTCGIEDGRLDGPYSHSVSITIPGTERAKTSKQHD